MKRVFTLAALALALPLAAQAAEGGGGMPQLRFSDERLIGMVVWLVVIFGLLYYVAVKYLLPPVGEVLADRAARIAADLDTARDVKAEADHAIRATRRATDEARAKAQAEVATALQTAGATAQHKAEAAAAVLAARTAEAEARISASRDRAMGALRDVATDTAVALVARLGVTAAPAQVGAAVDAALTQRAA